MDFLGLPKIRPRFTLHHFRFYAFHSSLFYLESFSFHLFLGFLWAFALLLAGLFQAASSRIPFFFFLRSSLLISLFPLASFYYAFLPRPGIVFSIAGVFILLLSYLFPSGLKEAFL